MTDREMLEFAAKAFGCVSYVDGMGWIHEDELGARGAWWNPIDNDGDAFRLAVRVGLCMFLGKFDPLDVWSICVSSAECGDELSVGTIEGHDEMEVSRRAITRAAAEIGKRMP